MKRLLLTLSLIIATTTAYSQFMWSIDFDSPAFSDQVYPDTVSNPNCIWQVGAPTKSIFTSANSLPNVIVTDTLNPVPASDTSSFYLKHYRSDMPFHWFSINFWYNMDGDTSDFGMIEISPDNGLNWINLLTEDTTFDIYWIYPKPTLIGSTNGWQNCYFDMSNWASGFLPYPVPMNGDSVLFRFTYISDSSSIPRDGWMIDDINIADVFEGIGEIQHNDLISIYPNPTSDALHLRCPTESTEQYIQILNSNGQVLIEQNFDGETIDTRNLSNGIYFLNYSNAHFFSIKKFEVSH